MILFLYCIVLDYIQCIYIYIHTGDKPTELFRTGAPPCTVHASAIPLIAQGLGTSTCPRWELASRKETVMIDIWGKHVWIYSLAPSFVCHRGSMRDIYRQLNQLKSRHDFRLECYNSARLQTGLQVDLLTRCLCRVSMIGNV